MPTNDERREVAAKLRKANLAEGAEDIQEIQRFDYVTAVRFVMWPNLVSVLFRGKPIVSMHEIIERLADLIEPEPEPECVANIIFTKEQQEELFQRVMKELRVNINLTEAVDAICGQMCGDGWDWRMRAETVVRTVAEMCGAKVVE